MEMPDRGWYKVTGVVTNRRRLRKASGIPGDELIWWYRQRCGKGEEVHGVLKRTSPAAGCRRGSSEPTLLGEP